MMEKERLRDRKITNSNYIWRIVFTFMIVLGHSGFVEIANASYYIGVEYFFIISGFFLAKSAIKNENDVLGYTWERIKKLYPHIIFSFIVFYIYVYRGYENKEMLKEIVYHLYEVVPMMYFILPIKNDNPIYLNFSVWYISVLLICGMVVYFFYSNYKKQFVSIVAPMIVLIGYYYLSKHCGSFNTGGLLGFF